jgi:hypothetical protein
MSVIVVAGLVPAAVLAGSGVAAAQPGGARAAATAPGTITTIAGGIGGPGKATDIALSSCGAGYGAGSL